MGDPLYSMKVELHVIPTEVVFFNLTGTLTEGNSNHQKNWYFSPSTSNFSQLLELKVYRRHAGVVGHGVGNAFSWLSLDVKFRVSRVVSSWMPPKPAADEGSCNRKF